MLKNQYINADLNFKNANSFINSPDTQEAEKYIIEYFDSRSKACVFNISFTDEDSIHSRDIHTVSAFLLGMNLKEIVEKQLRDFIRNKSSIENKNFEYPWFLCCLYHDVFSEYEKHHKSVHYDSLNEYMQQLDIKYIIYDPFDFARFSLKPFINTYSLTTVSDYYKYRTQQKRLDHGIVSGFYAFDRLTKNFIKEWEKNGRKDYPFYTHVPGHTLVWDKKQIWIFALVADAIIAHNIWHLSEDDLPDEVRLGSPKEKKLDLKDDPLAYYLSLIDTIEPIKCFHTSDPSLVFDNISIELQGKKLLITQSELSIFNFKEWIKRMQNMGDWLKNTKAEYVDKKTIHIFLPI